MWTWVALHCASKWGCCYDRKLFHLRVTSSTGFETSWGGTKFWPLCFCIVWLNLFLLCQANFAAKDLEDTGHGVTWKNISCNEAGGMRYGKESFSVAQTIQNQGKYEPGWQFSPQQGKYMWRNSIRWDWVTKGEITRWRRRRGARRKKEEEDDEEDEEAGEHEDEEGEDKDEGEEEEEKQEEAEAKIWKNSNVCKWSLYILAEDVIWEYEMSCGIDDNWVHWEVIRRKRCKWKLDQNTNLEEKRR